jgi:hypothetical protein
MHKNTMGMMNLKIINASQGHIHHYKNTKRKLYDYIANIYFNRQCLQKKLTPTYAKIKIPSSSPTAKHTLRKNSCVFDKPTSPLFMHKNTMGMMNLKMYRRDNLEELIVDERVIL